MKKTVKFIVATALCVITAFNLFGCLLQEDGFALRGAELPHYDGVSTAQGENGYDSRLFYRNDLTLFGGDSDVLWVSKEDARKTAEKHVDPAYSEEEKQAYIDSYVDKYGDWFYQYTSGNGGVATMWWDERDYTGAITCLRSRDLNDWELCGDNNGFSVKLTKEGWIKENTWAPEVIFDQTERMFYMYFSASSFYAQKGDLPTNPFGIAVLRSVSPNGPFELCTSEGQYGSDSTAYPAEQKYDMGKAIGEETVTRTITKKDFQIDIGRHFDLPYAFPVIDISPFEDTDGKKYLYFSKEYINTGSYNYPDSIDFARNEDGTMKTDENGNYILSEKTYSYDVMSIWCMEMTDWFTPKYETLRMVAYPGYKSVSYKEGQPIFDDASYTLNEEFEDEGTLVEGAQMLTHTGEDGKKRYYLTYSQTGYAARNYGVHQAVSESPYGPFVKIGRTKSVINTSVENDYMTGGGHHAFVEAAGELFCVYWVHCDPINASLSGVDGRVYAFDRTVYTADEELGYDILFGNGPTNSLQAKPYVATGYKNIADQANITVSSASDNVKWLNDGTFTTLEVFDNREYTFNGQAEITLTFETPVTIGALMVYNSMYYDTAFSKIDAILFKLAEKPAWYELDAYDGYLYIKDLPFSERYYNATDGFMRQGGSAVASFNDITVSEIKISVSSKLNDNGTTIGLSEIVVLGK